MPSQMLRQISVQIDASAHSKEELVATEYDLQSNRDKLGLGNARDNQSETEFI